MNPPKVYKCKIKAPGCYGDFIKRSSFQKTCGNHLCALELVKIYKQKQDRKELASKKIALKTRSQWLKEAQSAFNAWVRKRDELEPCICCGWATLSCQWHAGHYQTTKSRPGLRFHPANCHKQTAQCNLYHSGRISSYRPRLIAKVGEEMVTYLETANPRSDWTIEEIKEIKEHYKMLLKSIS